MSREASPSLEGASKLEVAPGSPTNSEMLENREGNSLEGASETGGTGARSCYGTH